MNVAVCCTYRCGNVVWICAFMGMAVNCESGIVLWVWLCVVCLGVFCGGGSVL